MAEQATALRAELSTAQKAAAEAQRSAQTAAADLQAAQASHAHQLPQLQSQLEQAQEDCSALQVGMASLHHPMQVSLMLATGVPVSCCQSSQMC